MVTVAGQVHETRVDRTGGIAESQGGAGHGHAAATDRLEAREGAQELALPVALDAREPDDLARSNDQVDVGEPRAAEAADLQEDRRRPPGGSGLGGKTRSISRPAMSSRTRSSVTSARANVPRSSPSRRTVTRSAMRMTSGRRCET